MRATTILAVPFLVLLTLATVSPLQADDAAKNDKKAAKEPRPVITISKETTYITRPLRKDGYVDYVAALNERCSKGVTPQNNAAVLLWRAMGPKLIEEETRDRFFKLLGMAPLPEKGEYFVSFDNYLERPGVVKPPEGKDPGAAEQEAHKRFDHALARPWAKKECPIVAAWLKANEKPLRLVAEGSRRPKCYMPLVATAEPPLISVSLPGLDGSRGFARALTARAMLRLHEGRLDEAWADLLAAHRLGRLIGQGPTLVDALVSIVIDGMVCSGEAALAHHESFTAKLAAKCRADLAKLPPLPKMVDKINTAERFMYLDAVAMVARKGPAALIELTGLITELTRLTCGPDVPTEPVIYLTGGAHAAKKPTLPQTLMKQATYALVDWDEVLKMGNSYYDRMVEAGKKPNYWERRKALEKFDDQIIKLHQESRDPATIARDVLLGRSPREIATRRMGGLLVSLLLPAVSGVLNAEDRASTHVQLTSLTLALGGYRSDHGQYPPSLAKLVPKYVAELPKDLYTQAEFRYKRRGKGLLLYSVGPNGADDGGRNALRDQVDEGDYEGDDIAVRVPPVVRQE